MKRLLSVLLIAATLLCFSGCDSGETNRTNFYYVRSEYDYGRQDGVMAPETRDTSDFTDALEILREYLAGPQDTNLASPFPKETKITEFLFKGKTLHITLSNQIVSLPKAKQVLACTCLARTAMELTGAEAVYFQTNSTGFSRMDPILIDKDSVLLYDDYHSVTPSERN